MRLMTPDDAYDTAGQIYLRLGWAYLKGEGTERNYREALRYFQKAEWYLYDLVENGDVMYMKSLKWAAEGQNRARAELDKKLPSLSWT